MTMVIATKIFVTFQVPGFHHWSLAPAQYWYLRSTHRHLFHVRVELRATADNYRTVEFIEFKDIATNRFKGLGKLRLHDLSCDFGNSSCETLAFQLGTLLLEENYAVARVEVSEDGENGAVVEFTL